MLLKEKNLVISDADMRKEGSRVVTKFIKRQLRGELPGSPLYKNGMFEVDFCRRIFKQAYGDIQFSEKLMHEALLERIVQFGGDAAILNIDVRSISGNGRWVQGCVFYGMKRNDGRIVQNAINSKLGYALAPRDGAIGPIPMSRKNHLYYNNIHTISVRAEYSLSIENVKFSFFSKLATGIVNGLTEIFGIRLDESQPSQENAASDKLIQLSIARPETQGFAFSSKISK